MQHLMGTPPIMSKLAAERTSVRAMADDKCSEDEVPGTERQLELAMLVTFCETLGHTKI